MVNISEFRENMVSTAVSITSGALIKSSRVQSVRQHSALLDREFRKYYRNTNNVCFYNTVGVAALHLSGWVIGRFRQTSHIFERRYASEVHFCHQTN
jgi:hypothetical protein